MYLLNSITSLILTNIDLDVSLHDTYFAMTSCWGCIVVCLIGVYMCTSDVHVWVCMYYCVHVLNARKLYTYLFHTYCAYYMHDV